MATTELPSASMPASAKRERTRRAASTLLNPVGHRNVRASAPSPSSTATFVAVDPTSMPT